MRDTLPSNTPFGAGLLFVGALQVAILANALAPLLPQQSVGTRRTTVRAWLLAVIGALAAEPLAVATTPDALDLAALWRRACAEQTDGDQVPLVSWATLVAIAERLAPVFDAAGLGGLEQRRRMDCLEGVGDRGARAALHLAAPAGHGRAAARRPRAPPGAL